MTVEPPCPVCGLALQVRGCTPGKCVTVEPQVCPKCGDEAFYVDLEDAFAYSCDSCDYVSPWTPMSATPGVEIPG